VLGTYNTISFETQLVKVFKLSLALVKLIQVLLGKCDSSVCLVHLDAEVILNTLDCQVLPQGAELVIDVQVVGCLIFPFALQKLKCLLHTGSGRTLEGSGALVSRK